MRIQGWIAAVAALALAACHSDEPGAAVYFHARGLSDAQVDSLERVFAEAPFVVNRVSGQRIPGGPWHGEVRLVRGADGPAELDHLSDWLRRQPGMVAVGVDSAVVFR